MCYAPAGSKREYHGAFQHTSTKHLQRYLNEFATCHNLRTHNTEDIMHDTVARMAGKRLTYSQLTAWRRIPMSSAPALPTTNLSPQEIVRAMFPSRRVVQRQTKPQAPKAESKLREMREVTQNGH